MMTNSLLNRLLAAGKLVVAVAALASMVGEASGQTNPSLPPRPRDSGGPVAPVPTGTASISGAVSIVGTGQFGRRARVTLGVSGGGPSRNTTTDENGRYAFTGLLAGRYSLNVSKPGHIGVSYGQTRPGRPGTPIQLTDNQRFDARLQLYKGGVITGTVLDEHGEAIPGTPVRVMRYVLQAGHRTLQQAGGASTDDRGMYRAFGLQPGDYVVAAVPRNTGGASDAERVQAELQSLQNRMQSTAPTDEATARELAVRASMLQAQMPAQEEQTTGYAPVYYPGTTAPAQAGPVALAPGEEKTGVDFQLQRIPVAKVEGVIVNSTGQALQNVQVTLAVSGVAAAPNVDSNNTRADAEGRFRLSNVAPGQYTLTAIATVNTGGQRGGGPETPTPTAARGTQPPQRPEPIRLWAVADVSIDGRNVSNVILTLQPGMSVSGRVAFGTTSHQAPADLTRVRVTLSPVETPGVPRGSVSSAPGRVDLNGRFTIPSVVPGKYRLTASNAGAGWFVESSIVDGLDTLDFPIDIRPGQNVSSAVVTFTDRQAELSGTIVNGRGQPAPDYTIVAYPADQRFWTPNSRRIRTARPGTDGQFTFGNLPPGEYRLAPIVDAEPGSWFDPAFLQQLETGAVKVTIGEGEKKAQTLQVGG